MRRKWVTLTFYLETMENYILIGIFTLLNLIMGIINLKNKYKETGIANLLATVLGIYALIFLL